MTSPAVSTGFVILMQVLCIAAAHGQDDSLYSGALRPPYVLEAGNGLQWRKGNLHTHSNWSDGDDYLECIALWYRERDYDFLSITDHNTLQNEERWHTPEVAKGGWVAYDKLIRQFPADWIVKRMHPQTGQLQVRLKSFQEVSTAVNVPGEFLLVQGEEISDQAHGAPIHLNLTNTPELITPRRGETVAETIQNNVDAALALRERTGQKLFIHLNHPNFHYAVTIEDLMGVVGEKFFEVYNGHPQVNNHGDETHPGTERMWDVILTWRLEELDLPVMFGLAVDDGHNYHGRPDRNSRPGRGWVMVLTEELTSDALVDALEAGKFYSSSGVTLQRIEGTGTSLNIEIAPVEGETYVTEFIGTRIGFDSSAEPIAGSDDKQRLSKRYSSDVGAVLARVEGTSATYEFQGDEIYVRARVTSSALHANPSEPGDFKQAWVQPVIP